MRIALLEDDVDQAELLKQWLHTAGHGVAHFADAEQFLRETHRDTFDLYILDWMLPRSSGIGALKQLRARDPAGPPVLFVTARQDESNIVEALRSGADDYMIKPVRKSETLARVDALCRRRVANAASVIDAPPFTLDLEQHQLSMRHTVVPLTEREFELALFLFRRAGQVVSREHLLETIWGVGHSTLKTRTVDTHVSRLRRKLGLDGSSGWRLTSIYQHGYRLENIAAPATDSSIRRQG